MTTGTVKWFNTVKGYGFITPDDGDKDVFVHVTSLEKSGFRSLEEGQKVSYEIAISKEGKQAASNIKILEEEIA